MLKVHPSSRTFGSRESTADQTLPRMKIKNLQIKKSRCNQFIPNEHGICGCGRLLDEHEINPKNQEQPKWDSLTCTVEDVDTDAFGTIRFNNNKDTVSKFIRVGQKTRMDQMTQVLFNCWKLEKPKLLISVTGGAQNFGLKSKLKDVFRKGLVKAAQSTNAWISTGGMNAGVMKHVGEAISSASLNPKQKIVVLGISNWCTVKNKNNLIKKHPELENELFEYSTNPALLTTAPSTSGEGKSAFLDPNHSHFVLVDNSQLNVYGGEIDFRGRLEKAIVSYEKDIDLNESISNNSGNGNETPIVVLVLEGGPNTLNTVLSSVKNGSPCVFIEGSGKCADLFAFALSRLTIRDESSKTESLRPLDETLRAEISEKILMYFNKPPKPILKSFEEILEYPHLLTVYRLSYDELGNDIDIAILRSLLKAKKDNYKAQLKLCLTWNRIDIAKNFIFTDDKVWNSEFLNDLFYMAIVQDRVDFVEVFLENGCDANQFLTVRKLIRLYNDIPKHSLLYKTLIRNKRNKSKEDKFVFKLKEVGDVIEELLVGLYQHQFSKRPIGQITTNKTYQILEQTDEYGNRNLLSNLPSSSNTDISNNIDNICMYSDHELFMYCVLTGKAEMAKLFWNYGTNKICSALVASKIFKSYNEIYEDEEDVYKELSKNFENMALEVLETCADSYQDAAQLMLLRPIPEFGNATALQIAYTAGDKNFLSSPTYQQLLVKLWYGQIDIDSSTMKILLAVFLPIFSPSIINLESDKNKLNLEAMKRQAEDSLEKKESKKDIEMNPLDSELEVESEIKVKQMSYLSKIYYFFRAPYVKFIYNQISFLLFLLLLSYVMLCEFYPIRQLNEEGYEIGEDVKIPEMVLIVWVFVFALDELRFLIFAKMETNLSGLKIGEYFGDFWNWVKFMSIILFTVGIVLRFIPNYDCYLAARIILCIDVLFWFFRSLHSYSFIRSLGPKLVMIRRMINELMYFILIVIVFIFAYGVATQALMYHNQELDLSLLKNVFFPAYFVIGGEYFEREKLMEVDECEASNFSELALTDRYTQDDCPEQNGANVSLGLLVFYLIMLNILLVNLLIAIFSNTYEEVQSEADKIWKYQRYALVYEYYYRPFLASPFTVFYYVFEAIRFVVRWILSFCINMRTQDNSIALLSSSQQERLRSLEDFIADEYIRTADSRSKETLDYKIQSNINKLELINHRLDELNESRQEMSSRISELHEKMDKLLSALAIGGGKKMAATTMTAPSTSSATTVERRKVATDSVDSSSAAAARDMELTRMVPLSAPPPSTSERTLYSGSTSVYKALVPENKKSWDVKFAEYNPTVYTSVQVLNSDFADTDILSMPIDTRPFINFNSFDDINGLDRRSCMGDYAVHDCLPLNPLGRTGITGRGSLLYWGPNQVYEIAFTRYKRNSSGEIIMEGGKRQVEFIVVKKHTTGDWCLPTVAQRKSAVFHDLIQREVVDQLFQVNREDHREMLTLLKNPIIISRYSRNSEVNTDNAWQEYVLVNFHDQYNKILSKVIFKNDQVEWKQMDASLVDVKAKDAVNLNLRKIYKHFFL